MRRRLLPTNVLLASLMLAAGLSQLHAQENLEATGLRARAQAFIDMLSGRLQPEEFIHSHMSPEFIEKRGLQRGAFIFRVLTQRYRRGPARLESLAVKKDVAVLKASNERNEWAEYDLFLQPGDRQGRLGGFNARIIPTPLGDQLAGLGEDEIIAELGRHLAEQAARDDFSGSVILARNGKVLYQEALGLAHRDSKTANTTETVYNLASTTKLFTGLAICQLEEAGKLAYRDNVGKHLPHLPNRRLREDVTIEQLLTHTSGLPAATLLGPHGAEDGLSAGEDPGLAPAAGSSLEERVMSLALQPLATEPGASYVYSNIGPLILGLIIETVSGMSYEDYIRTHVLEPAGMSTAGFPPGVSRELRATGYDRGGTGDRVADTGMYPGPGAPSAGLWASARDLLAFAAAITSNRLVKAETLKEMTHGKVKVGDQESYAFGWMDKEVNGMRSIGHTGNLPGWSSDFSIMPDSGYTLIVLCNGDWMATPVADRVRHMLSLSRD